MEQLAKDLIKAVQSTQHVGEDSYLDYSLEEHLLARREPDLYDLYVNGIRHIVVKDAGIEVRYKWVDGELVNIAGGRF